jgi:methyl-accepting chemotaxis protein
MVSKSVREPKSTTSNSTSNSTEGENFTPKEMQPLLKAMKKAIAGDFSVRLEENNGLGEIATVFNQWVSCNQTFADGISQVGHQVGVEGKLNERLTQSKAKGAWSTSVEAINSLIDNLATPTIEIERVLSAIAKGDLTQKMALEIDGKQLQGQLYAAMATVNDTIDQIKLFTTEVTRITREIGAEGKLGSQATVKNAAGIWQELITSVNSMSTQLNEQISSIAQIMQVVSQGDLTSSIEIENAGEFKFLTDNVNRTISNLNDSISQMTEVASVVASSSEEVTAVSQGMRDDANQTAEQATAVSASAEQVSQNANIVATAVEEMNASIREIAKNAAEGATVSTEAVKTADSTNETITKLGQSSIEIGKVIKVITSIAQQTNLLALNATIEAARAGDAGRGFAVVANEVKELAKQTATATEDISQRIEAIQNDSNGAVKAIAEITEVIDRINDLQNTIASAVEEQTATTNEIARNVAEAAKGSSDIAKNIGIVAQNAQSTTTGASNTSQAAGELARMAVDLQQIVNRFRV